MIDVNIILCVSLKAYDMCRITVFSQCINSGELTLSAYLFCSVPGMGIPGHISILRMLAFSHSACNHVLK